jgi:hypothetical protein
MQKEYDAIITNMAKLLEVQQKRELVAVDMIKAAILAEREACAVTAEKESLRGLPEEQPEGEELLRACAQIAGGVLIADAIRARGHS